jgi:putative colanic acid biosynthesis glycosyltransferase WcaI
MRILIVGLNFAPEPVGVGKYTGEMAAWLAARGHEVAVITTRPYYPDWKRQAGLSRLTWRRETWQDCRVIRCPIYVPRTVTGIRRLLHLGSFATSAIPAVVAQLGRIDVVAAIAPTLLSAPVALAIARLAGAKTWLHVQDLELDAARELGIVTSDRAAGMARRIERWIMQRFDLVTAVSQKIAAAVETKGVPPERIALFPNWVDLAAIHPLPKAEALRVELGIPGDSCVVLYSGSMGRKQGLESVIAAARILAGDPSAKIQFVLAGAGPVRAELESAAAGLPNVRFLPLTAPDRFNALLNMADIQLLPQLSGASDLVMPSKLGPMLAVGKPVVATVPEDSQIAATMRGGGLVVPPEDLAALVAALGDLAADPQRRAAMGQAALQIARSEYAADKIMPAIERRLNELVGGGRALPQVNSRRTA